MADYARPRMVREARAAHGRCALRGCSCSRKGLLFFVNFLSGMPHALALNYDETKVAIGVASGEHIRYKGGGGILREILSSQIRTKSGGACSIGTRKGVSGSGSPRDRNGVEGGGR